MTLPELDDRVLYIAQLRSPLCADIRIACVANNPQEVIDYVATLCWRVVDIQVSCGFLPDDVLSITIE